MPVTLWRTAAPMIAVAAGLAWASNAQGATIVWDMSGGAAPPGHSVGTTANFTAGGITISASGFTSPALTTAATLFEKNGGADEIGLGLTNDPSGENEITGTNVVLVNFSNAVAAGVQAGTFDFKMNSSTSPDAWAVLGSNTGTAGSFSTLMTGSDESVHTIAGGPDKFYLFEATSGNVLLSEVSGVTPAVPEPSTWAMMLIGFLGLGFAFRQSRRKVSPNFEIDGGSPL